MWVVHSVTNVASISLHFRVQAEPYQSIAETDEVTLCVTISLV